MKETVAQRVEQRTSRADHLPESGRRHRVIETDGRWFESSRSPCERKWVSRGDPCHSSPGDGPTVEGYLVLRVRAPPLALIQVNAERVDAVRLSHTPTLEPMTQGPSRSFHLFGR